VAVRLFLDVPPPTPLHTGKPAMAYFVHPKAILFCL
jgi:hypothetical protein